VVRRDWWGGRGERMRGEGKWKGREGMRGIGEEVGGKRDGERARLS
jgi:hypothetical protein